MWLEFRCQFWIVRVIWRSWLAGQREKDMGLEGNEGQCARERETRAAKERDAEGMAMLAQRDSGSARSGACAAGCTAGWRNRAVRAAWMAVVVAAALLLSVGVVETALDMRGQQGTQHWLKSEHAWMRADAQNSLASMASGVPDARRNARALLQAAPPASETQRNQLGEPTRYVMSLMQMTGLLLVLVSGWQLAKRFASDSLSAMLESQRFGYAMYALLSLVFSVFVTSNLMLLSDLEALSMVRFLQFFFAGGICAFITHAACTPLDVVKTRLQTSASDKYSGSIQCLNSIIKEEGPGALLTGLGATATGYFLHGAFKYSFYEMFKLILIPDVAAATLKPPLRIAAMAGFLAECVASLLLCPMEAIRIRSVADPSFPGGVLSGLRTIFKLEGLEGLYKGLPSILLKQVPYTVGQFVAFEFAVKLVKLIAELVLGGLESISGTGAALISLAAGILAGMIAGVLSHPGDTILSKINQETSSSESSTGLEHIVSICRKLGLSGLFLGLGTRLIQVALMIGGQFLIYDTVKMLCGIKIASAATTAEVKAVQKGR
ncbi:Mitochondrial substrate carrier family protein N [Porphyridium purpureum]|uniref:Mitochondrial substrate carrier family protein N n=1 Tax=Porphyridium purpureum TaxID=35688 RepID=A0A5J4YRX9_PORPP|nr:Mitochondrial substrate carrier family protein N [Porphyridium purpureum]|eukprot:POR9204..scf236_6